MLRIGIIGDLTEDEHSFIQRCRNIYNYGTNLLVQILLQSTKSLNNIEIITTGLGYVHKAYRELAHQRNILLSSYEVDNIDNDEERRIFNYKKIVDISDIIIVIYCGTNLGKGMLRSTFPLLYNKTKTLVKIYDIRAYISNLKSVNEV